MRKKGLLLYESYCRYTNEWVTWTQSNIRGDGAAIVDAICDGVLIRKYKGNYYLRNTPCAVNIMWYGAKNDYNPRTGIGTDNSAALQLAFRTMGYYQQFTTENTGNGFKGSAFKLYIPRGNFLFTTKNAFNNAYTANRGISIAGDGKFATNVFFRCDEAGNGTDNFFIRNANINRDSSFIGIRFYAVTGTERFYYYSSTGTASSLFFWDCTWENWRLGIDVQGTANCSENRFHLCSVKAVKDGDMFINLNNPQSVNWSFIDTDFEGIAGTAINVLKGGQINFQGGSMITLGAGLMLKLDDTTGTGIGATNGAYNFKNIKTEIRDTSKFITCNAPSATISMDNCFMEVNNATSATRGTWATAVSYALNDTVNIGGLRGRAFKCLLAHTSDSLTQPLLGANWATNWQPLYEFDMTAGTLTFTGGRISTQIALRYSASGYTGLRPLLYMDGAFIDRQPYDLVDIINTDSNTNIASAPKADFVNMRGFGTNAPFSVTLNQTSGYLTSANSDKLFIYRTGIAATSGLPSSGVPGSFLLPRGALIKGVGIVSESGTLSNNYTIANSEKTFLSEAGFDNIHADMQPFSIDTEAKRTINFTSNAGAVAQGYAYIIYS